MSHDVSVGAFNLVTWKKADPRDITGALGFVIVTIGTLIFGAAVVSFDEEMQNLDGDGAAASDGAEVEAAEEQAEEEAEAEGAEAQEEDGQEPTPAEDPGDEGSRENPLPMGETVSNDEWEVTIPDGDDEGALRVRLGFISTEDHFFDTQ